MSKNKTVKLSKAMDDLAKMGKDHQSVLGDVLALAFVADKVDKIPMSLIERQLQRFEMNRKHYRGYLTFLEHGGDMDKLVKGGKVRVLQIIGTGKDKVKAKKMVKELQMVRGTQTSVRNVQAGRAWDKDATPLSKAAKRKAEFDTVAKFIGAATPAELKKLKNLIG
jgi:hypothetical protein